MVMLLASFSASISAKHYCAFYFFPYFFLMANLLLFWYVNSNVKETDIIRSHLHPT